MGEKKECPSAAIKLTKTWHHSLNFVLDPLRLYFFAGPASLTLSSDEVLSLKATFLSEYFPISSLLSQPLPSSRVQLKSHLLYETLTDHHPNISCL